jgi:hypothetical protein
VNGTHKLAIAAALLAAQTTAAEFYGDAGIGVAPIYIEEIVTDRQLTAGATVTPVYSMLEAGALVHPNHAVFLAVHHHWYIDAESQIYLTGVLGLGTAYVMPELGDFRVQITGGIAHKVIFGSELSATGWGLNLGVSKAFGESFKGHVNYSFLALDGTASSYATGDETSVSSLQLGVSYRWM